MNNKKSTHFKFLRLKFKYIGYYTPINFQYRQKEEDFTFRESKSPDKIFWFAAEFNSTEIKHAEDLTNSQRTVLNQFLPKELANIILYYNPILCPIYFDTTVHYSTFKNSKKYRYDNFDDNFDCKDYIIPHFISYITFEDIITRGYKDLSIFDYFRPYNSEDLKILHYYKCLEVYTLVN